MTRKTIVMGALAAALAAGAPERAGAQQTLACGSRDLRRAECAADTRGGVYLLRQLSESACAYGLSWGYGRAGVWVKGGCRAQFVVDLPPAPGPVSAADALRVCRNATVARLGMPGPASVHVDPYPPDRRGGRAVAWSTPDRRAGSCRVGPGGVVTAWRVEGAP